MTPSLWVARDPIGYVFLFWAKPVWSTEREQFECADDDPHGDCMSLPLEFFPGMEYGEVRRLASITLEEGET
jgi:hypothetical protein